MLEHVCDKELRELRAEIERLGDAEDRALDYARRFYELRMAAWALLNHDTDENRARLHELAVGEEWMGGGLSITYPELTDGEVSS